MPTVRKKLKEAFSQFIKFYDILEGRDIPTTKARTVSLLHGHVR